jgi:hypothetical protein
MSDIQPPSPVENITVEGGMIQRFRDWTQLITRAVNFLMMAEGSGSPETVLSSDANKFYRDTAGPNLYWKSVDDVAGDATKGWLLVI